MLLGFFVGLVLNLMPPTPWVNRYLTEGMLVIGGNLFINILKMLVVPVVFISLVCGTFNLDKELKLGKIATRTLLLYLFTTAVAISLALIVANMVGVGSTNQLIAKESHSIQSIPSMKESLINIFPSNPIKALAEGNMLQIIVFALLFGFACNQVSEKTKPIKELFFALEEAIMHLMGLVIKFAPLGIFCLVANLFALEGLGLIKTLASYFVTVLVVLAMQLVLTYGLLLRFYANLKPYYFFRHMLPAMLFAFSTSSSTASIPVVLKTVQEKLGVNVSIASFVIPLGATINMDGTAIMQGVATIFIANSYGIHLTLIAFLKVILTATLASIGTAGIPSVGLITLTMVLTQVGLPVEGIALIIGVDRLLDMSRTAVNVAGDAMVACSIARKENQLELSQYQTIALKE